MNATIYSPCIIVNCPGWHDEVEKLLESQNAHFLLHTTRKPSVISRDCSVVHHGTVSSSSNAKTFNDKDSPLLFGNVRVIQKLL